MDSDSRIVTVSVPATTANLGPGFDCLGMALDLRNEVAFTPDGPILIDGENETKYHLAIEGVDHAQVPSGRENLVVSAAETIFRLVGRRPATLDARLLNRIPVASGLGSSSTAIVAGLAGANALVDGGLTRDELLRLAVALEGHPDNVAPALLGGLVLGVLPDAAQGPAELVVCRLEPPRLTAIIVLPDFLFLTADARAALPTSYTRADAIFNASRLGLLLHAFDSGDFQHLRTAMGDRLHQSYRMGLIPGARAAYEAAYEAGALGVALSGAGPSLLAFAAEGGEAIARAMEAAFNAAGLACRAWILSPSSTGTRLVISEDFQVAHNF
jgi:homoserine kinase